MTFLDEKFGDVIFFVILRTYLNKKHMNAEHIKKIQKLIEHIQKMHNI